MIKFVPATSITWEYEAQQKIAATTRIRMDLPVSEASVDGCWVETSQAPSGLHDMVEGRGSPDCVSPAKPPVVPSQGVHEATAGGSIQK